MREPEARSYNTTAGRVGAGFAAGKTATSCAPKAHLRDQRFFSSKAGSNCISFLTRTKANRRLSPRMVTALKIHPNTKHPTAKRAACSTGRTVSDEIQQLQTTTRSLISRAKFRVMRAEYLNAVFPHMGEQSQKYRTKNLLTEDSRKSIIVFKFSFSYLCIREQSKKSLKPASDTRKPESNSCF